MDASGHGQSVPHPPPPGGGRWEGEGVGRRNRGGLSR